MRLLRPPHTGPGADKDTLGYWPLKASSHTAVVELSDHPAANRHGLSGSAPSAATVQLYGLPSSVPGMQNTQALTTSTVLLYDVKRISGASAEWSASFWYDFTTCATRGVVFSHEGTGAMTSVEGPSCRLLWTPASSSFSLQWMSQGTGLSSMHLAEVPSKGHFSLTSKVRNTQVSSFHNGQFVSAASNFVSAYVFLNAPTSATARWVVNGSAYSASWAAPGKGVVGGTMGDLIVTGRALSDISHLARYGAYKQYWDEQALFEANQSETYLAVEVEDSNSLSGWTRLADDVGESWVISASISEEVGSPQATANATLARVDGESFEASPMTTYGRNIGLLALRKKVRFLRAIVPLGHVMEGWEWRLRFQGYIDSWDVDTGTIQLACTDTAVALSDSFIADTKAYYYAVNEPMEQVISELISEYRPRLGRTDAEIVGYKGFESNVVPKNYTRSGSVASQWMLPANNNIRFNDVSTGGVFSALQSLVDNIGFDCRYTFYEPGEEYRLETFAPKRGRVIRHKQIRFLTTDTVEVEFYEPHGLTQGVALTIAGSTSLDLVGSVASVVDVYRVNGLKVGAGFSNVTLSGGSVSYTYNALLSHDDLFDQIPIRSDISTIRNHALVRFARVESTDTMEVSSIVRDGSGLLTITTEHSVENIDPDNRGFTFKLSGADGSAAPLMGDYSGLVTGRNTIVSTVPNNGGTGGNYPGTLTSTVVPLLTSVYEGFKEAISTASTSVAQYGVLPVSVYEGSTLAINTRTEAQALADALISDLSSPTMDLTATSRPLAFELNDIFRLQADPNRKWDGTVDLTIVGMRERYSGRQAEVEYALRYAPPTRGFTWVERIVADIRRPNPPKVNGSDMTSSLQDWRLNDAVSFARSVQLRRYNINRREMGLRHDRTIVYASYTANFIATAQDKVGAFRGDSYTIDSMPDGTTLEPGRPVYIRYASQDIFGNVSDITGLNTASTATTPALIPRFMTQTAGVLAATNGQSNLTVNTFTAQYVSIDSGGDASGLTYDNLNNYNTTSGLFQCPCAGVYQVLSESTWVGTKTASQTLGRVGHFNGSMATIGYSAVFSSATFASASFNRFIWSESVSCHSGDFLRCEVAGIDLVSRSNASTMIRPTTACTQFGKLAFALISQR